MIGIKLKRKKNYKNTHQHQLVDVNRLIKGLEYLVENNHLYKNSIIDRNFFDTCKEQDPQGHDFFIADNNEIENNVTSNRHTEQLDSEDDDVFMNYDSQAEGNSSNNENELDAQDKQYDEYVREDPIRRFQFNYDVIVAMAND